MMMGEIEWSKDYLMLGFDFWYNHKCKG